MSNETKPTVLMPEQIQALLLEDFNSYAIMVLLHEHIKRASDPSAYGEEFLRVYEEQAAKNLHPTMVEGLPVFMATIDSLAMLEDGVEYADIAEDDDTEEVKD